MPTIVKHSFVFIRGFLIILVFLMIGKVLAAQLPIEFPGSIVGLIFLLLGLTSGVIKIDWVLMTANIFLKYMVLLFIPLAVGLINYFDLMLENWIVILFSIFFSSFIMMLSVGHLFQYLNKKVGS